MRSLPSHSLDLQEGKTVQVWNPDEIFPSLTAESVNSRVDEMLQLFQPSKLENSAGGEQYQSATGGGLNKRQSVVSKWNLTPLESKPDDDICALGRYLGIEGIPVGIAADDRQQAVMEARRQAGETLRFARAKANEMILAAQLEVDKIRKDAYNEGRAQAESELQKATENAQTILEQMNAWRKETIRSNELLIIEMVRKISQLVFGDGVTLDGKSLQKNLQKAMKMAESLGDVRIYLNQQDTQIIDPEWKKFQETLSGKKIQIIPSDTILPGGCFIQGEMGAVDARVETQLNTVFDALKASQGNEKEAHP
jgi:flagellar biosynthesis/type III secretory pathway protein FliH